MRIYTKVMLYADSTACCGSIFQLYMYTEPQWNLTSMVDNLNGRRPQWKTTSMEATLMEDDLRGKGWSQLIFCSPTRIFSGSENVQIKSKDLIITGQNILLCRNYSLKVTMKGRPECCPHGGMKRFQGFGSGIIQVFQFNTIYQYSTISIFQYLRIPKSEYSNILNYEYI